MLQSSEGVSSEQRGEEEELEGKKRHFSNSRHWARSCSRMQCNSYRAVHSSLGKHGQGNPLQNSKGMLIMSKSQNSTLYTKTASRYSTQFEKTAGVLLQIYMKSGYVATYIEYTIVFVFTCWCGHTWKKFSFIWPSPSVSKVLKVSAGTETMRITYILVLKYFISVTLQPAIALDHWRWAVTGLTEHGLQSHQTGNKVVKVDSHVLLRVAQDDQLEQVVGQLETWRKKKKIIP